MRIIEKQMIGKKKNPLECEDQLVITDDFIAVVDGVTSKSAIKLNNCTTGRYAALVICDEIISFKADITVKEAIDAMTRAIEKVYIDNGLYEQAEANVTDRLAACVIIYSRSRKEIWSIGDCQCMVDGKTFAFSNSVNDIISETRALYIETELLKGKTTDELMEHDTSRKYVLPLIKAAAGFENSSVQSDYAYGVIDGFKTNERSVNVIDVKDNNDIILASDGYPKLFETLDKTENYLSYIMHTDPLCFRKYKCTKGLVRGNKSFDDRAYIRFEK